MTFLLFLLLNACLFIRPSELITTLATVPVYNIVMICNLVVSFGLIARLLSPPRPIYREPTSVCVFGVFGMILAASLARGDVGTFVLLGGDFVKVLAYYLLAVAVLNTPARLNRFLGCLAFFVIVCASASLLHYNGYVNIEALKLTERLEGEGEGAKIIQLNATGIYSDPNDFAMILTAAILVCMLRVVESGGVVLRVPWLGAMGLLFYALIMTQSRGGFLALVFGLLSLFVSRFGWRRAFLLGALTVPVLFTVVGGRSTQFGSVVDKGDTAAGRMEFWFEGLRMVARSPLVGVGPNQFVDQVGYVAHNSFVHATAELGLIGGACFFGVFYLPLRMLSALKPPAAEVLDPTLRAVRPYLIAMICGYMLSMMSISRNYGVATYMIPALAASFLRTVETDPPEAATPSSGALVKRLAVGYLVFLFGIFILVRTLVR